MKVIFLDVDGVLNNEGTHRRRKHPAIERHAVRVLDTIIQQTGASIVISSSWRIVRSLAEIRSLLYAMGLRPDAQIIGATPDLDTERAHEIQAWLDANGPVESFVILDDEPDMLHLQPHLVQTDFATGLRASHGHIVVRRLGQRIHPRHSPGHTPLN